MTYFYFLAPQDRFCCGKERALGSPDGWGACGVPTGAHIRLSQGASPLAWYFFPGVKCGAQQGAPCWERAYTEEALPSHHPANGPLGQQEGSMWKRPTEQVLRAGGRRLRAAEGQV